MHREDIKAAIRKRFGTVAAFEQANGLPAKSVNDVLRGRTNARVAKAIKQIPVTAPESRGTVDNYTTKTRSGNPA